MSFKDLYKLYLLYLIDINTKLLQTEEPCK